MRACVFLPIKVRSKVELCNSSHSWTYWVWRLVAYLTRVSKSGSNHAKPLRPGGYIAVCPANSTRAWSVSNGSLLLRQLSDLPTTHLLLVLLHFPPILLTATHKHATQPCFHGADPTSTQNIKLFPLLLLSGSSLQSTRDVEHKCVLMYWRHVSKDAKPVFWKPPGCSCGTPFRNY